MSSRQLPEFRTEWVRIGDMRIPDPGQGQRGANDAHAEALAHYFEKHGLESMRPPTGAWDESHHFFWIVDGQHTIRALKLLGFSDEDKVECEARTAMSTAQRAELFLARNAGLAVKRGAKFANAVTAGRRKEVEINAIVEGAGLKVSDRQADNCVSAVGALEDAYDIGAEPLARSLAILRDAYNGDPAAFRARLLTGMTLVCNRYDGRLDDERMAHRLSELRGGTIIVTRKAHALRLRTGHNLKNCTAGAFVEVYNQGRGGSKLESWWS